MDSHPNTDAGGEEIVEVRVIVGAVLFLPGFEMKYAFEPSLLSATRSCLLLVPLWSGKSFACAISAHSHVSLRRRWHPRT